MKRFAGVLAFALLPLVTAFSQASPTKESIGPPDTGCAYYPNPPNGPFTCPQGLSCGQYWTLSYGQQCDDQNLESCYVLEPIGYCCGKYRATWPIDPCMITEMKDPHFRSRILEIAEENDVLVPTCNGAYLPARIALGQSREREKEDGSF
jgi:hypothetical protein